MTHWRSSRSPLADGYSPSSIRQRNYPTGTANTPVPRSGRGFSFPPFEPIPNENPSHGQEQNSSSNAVLLNAQTPASPQDMDFPALILVSGFFVSVGAIFVMLWLAFGFMPIRFPHTNAETY